SSPVLASSPAPGTRLTPGAPIRLTFSQPLTAVLGSARPELSPRTPGSWQQPDSHTLVFSPSGFGAGFATDLHLRLPRAVAIVGFAGARVWQALLADAIAGKRRPGGYSYVYVHSSLPQSLTLWHNGPPIPTSPGNPGVPAAPTQLGTFPVFEHIPVGTMSGTNPDGSRYHDPGIRYISYFNGGDAIHAFNRASFGTPQRLGCVELPLASAAKVWPYTPIGTLVTVEH